MSVKSLGASMTNSASCKYLYSCELKLNFLEKMSVSPKEALNKISKLVGNAESFDMAFNIGLEDDSNNQGGDMIKMMIQDSKRFVIGQQEFVFNEKEQIFFRESPVPEQKLVSKAKC